MRGGEGLGDLADDVYETVTELLGSGAGVDVLVDHTLGALTAMRLCEDVPDSPAVSCWRTRRQAATTRTRTRVR